MKKTIVLTKEGRADLENELKTLISRRPELAERVATARDFGDLKENQEYTDAREEMKLVEGRILDIQDILANSEVIQAKQSDKVGLGNTVKVNDGSRDSIYMIVGAEEANPLEGKISNESPIGIALFGKKVGESADFETPKGKVVYKIVSID
jgi:transcription elongation factor GreA